MVVFAVNYSESCGRMVVYKEQIFKNWEKCKYSPTLLLEFGRKFLSELHYSDLTMKLKTGHTEEKIHQHYPISSKPPSWMPQQILKTSGVNQVPDPGSVLDPGETVHCFPGIQNTF